MTQIFNDPIHTQQSTDEDKAYPCDLTVWLRDQSGVSVSSATAVLIDPDGNKSTPATAVDVTSNVVTPLILATEIDETGDWKLDIVATLTGSTQKPAWRFEITVPY